MSELGMNEHGMISTAAEFHDEYIRNGTVYKDFFCPFCQIEYTPKAIYVDHKVGVRPHFARHRGIKHRFNCDGKPKITQNIPKHPPATKVLKTEMDVPEALVLRRRPVVLKQHSGHRDDPPDATEIERRRSAPGLYSRTAVYSSSLVRTFAEAYLEIIYLCHVQNKAATNINDIIKSELTKHRLDLFGTKRNYYSGFRQPYFSPDFGGTYIYDFKDSQVQEISDGYEIESVKPATIKGGNYPVCAIIHKDTKEVDLRCAHAAILSDLENAARKNLPVRAFCCGSIEMVNDRCDLHIHNLDLIYLRNKS